jgi:O-antigen biosynthesis protein
VPEGTSNDPIIPRVSAILVSYNQASALRRALAALEQSQDRERLEILVIDCASDDESKSMDTEFPAINMMRLPHHLGAARAMNIATRTAKADLLLFLSPNVEVAPATIPALADRLEPESNLSAVCPLLTGPDGQVVTRVRKLPTKDTLAAAVAGQALPSSMPDQSQESAVEFPGMDALMVRKHLVRSMNYFDLRYGHYWADADLAAQIRKAGKKILLCPSIRATYHAAVDPLADDSLAQADLVTGAAAFLGKYKGGMAGFSFRFRAALAALGRFDVGKSSAILSGSKLDGTQAR